jgi:hypothetical protein
MDQVSQGYKNYPYKHLKILGLKWRILIPQNEKVMRQEVDRESTEGASDVLEEPFVSSPTIRSI